jgi:hypothetical protein
MRRSILAGSRNSLDLNRFEGPDDLPAEHQRRFRHELEPGGEAGSIDSPPDIQHLHADWRERSERKPPELIFEFFDRTVNGPIQEIRFLFAIDVQGDPDMNVFPPEANRVAADLERSPPNWTAPLFD